MAAPAKSVESTNVHGERDYAAPNISAGDTPGAQEITWLPTAAIQASTFNPRKSFDPAALTELADSLAKHGMLQPIVVRPVDAGMGWEVVAGERRWRAAQLAGLETVPARVAQLDDAQALEIAIVENLQRRDLNPIEEAQGLAALRDRLGMRQTAIAAAVKRSQPTVARALSLLKLPEDVQDLLQQGALTPSHAEILQRYQEYPALQSAIAAYAAKHGVTVKELEQPLPDQHRELRDELVRAGLVKELGSSAPFDTNLCKQCPHGAYRAGKFSYMNLCLRPDHFAQLTREAVVAREQQVAAAVAKVRQDGKEGLPKLSDLGYGKYEQIGRGHAAAPAGCSTECPCRGMGLDWNDKAVPICTDPARYKKLQAADTRAANAAKRERARRQITNISLHLQDLAAIEAPELAVLIYAVVCTFGNSQRSKEVLSQSIDRTVPGQLVADRVPQLDELVKLAPIDLIRFGVDALLTNQLLTALDNEYLTPTGAIWYGKHFKWGAGDAG